MSLRRFFRRRYWDAERVQEFETHIQNEIDDNLARGMTREEARRQAYLKFGNPTRVREEIWKMNSIAPFENFLRDVRYAWRTLLRNPGYAWSQFSHWGWASARTQRSSRLSTACC